MTAVYIILWAACCTFIAGIFGFWIERRARRLPIIDNNLPWPLTWIRAACTIIGRRLNAFPDAIAAQLDWDITVTHWGLGRVYRDRRFGAAAEDPPLPDPGQLA